MNVCLNIMDTFLNSMNTCLIIIDICLKYYVISRFLILDAFYQPSAPPHRGVLQAWEEIEHYGITTAPFA